MDFKEYLRAARLDPEKGDKIQYMTMVVLLQIILEWQMH